MSRISKVLAKEIATKLMLKHKKLVDDKKEVFRKAFEKSYKKSIPKKILELSTIERQYVGYKNYTATDNRFGYKNVDFNESLPEKDGWHKYNPKGEDNDKLVRLYDDYNNEKTQYKETLREVGNGVYALRTHARLIADWPEAGKLIPKKEILLPAVNVELIKSKIKGDE